MSSLSVAPYLSVTTQVEGGALRVSAGSREDWFAASLERDLAESAGLKPPWLPRLEGARTSAVFALPERGLTLRALWPALQVEERVFATLRLLETLIRAWPVSMFPRSGVLCGSDGTMWLVPPFKTLVEGASKTWDDFQFDEYCIGGISSELTHGLAMTVQRLLVGLPLNEFFLLRRLTPHPPSLTVAWLRPLDALVARANDELLDKRTPTHGEAERWAATIAVLEDQYQQSSALGFAELVERAWANAPEDSRWGQRGR